jgi:hypothetical protein
MVKKEKKKETKGEEMTIIDIPKTARCRLEIVLTTLKAGEVSRERIVIGLDDGGGNLSLSEAKDFAKVILEMSRPKLERLYGLCFPYYIILHMGKERHTLLAPCSGRKKNDWSLDD